MSIPFPSSQVSPYPLENKLEGHEEPEYCTEEEDVEGPGTSPAGGTSGHPHRSSIYSLPAVQAYGDIIPPQAISLAHLTSIEVTQRK